MRFQFGECALDPATRELERGGQVVHVEPQVFDLLVHLINRRDHVVSKDELMSVVWKGRFVSDSTLSTRITAARQAIGDSGEHQAFIRTIARRGFRFVGDLLEVPSGRGDRRLVLDGPDASTPVQATDKQQSAGSHHHINGDKQSASLSPTLVTPDKPSIAVLAFGNLSGDPEQEYFADGIAEDIITTLSKLRWLFVISRNSSFSYKGKPIDIRRVGSELGVRYVLEGSVRKGGNQVRITAQLTDTTDGHHVWAERYERAFDDIFAVQDEISRSIIGAIAPGILAAEVQRTQRKASTELDQWERMMRARWHIRRFTREGSAEAIRLLEEVVARQPDNALAFADLALAHHFAHGHGWAKSPAEAITRRGEAAHSAVAADDQDAVAQAALGIHELFMGQHSDALRRLHYAVELDPNSSFAYGMLGVAYCFSGECDPAIRHAQEAMRLSPRDFLMNIWVLAHAWAHLSVENYEKATNSAKRSIECNPAFPDAHGVLAASLAHLGRIEDARSALLDFTRLKPGLTLNDDRLNRPFRRREDRERYLDGLRKAGLPE